MRQVGASRDNRPRNQHKHRIAGRLPREARETMTIARKLGLGFGVLILIFFVAGLTILHSAATMNRELTKIVVVEEPVRAAAYEMDINTVEICRDVRVYMINGDP